MEGGNPVPAITSLNPTKVTAGSQVPSSYVNGTNFLNISTVTYNGVLHNSALQSPTQLQIALGPSDVATTGAYPVVVTNPSPRETFRSYAARPLVTSPRT